MIPRAKYGARCTKCKLMVATEGYQPAMFCGSCDQYMPMRPMSEAEVRLETCPHGHLTGRGELVVCRSCSSVMRRISLSDCGRVIREGNGFPPTDEEVNLLLSGRIIA